MPRSDTAAFQRVVLLWFGVLMAVLQGERLSLLHQVAINEPPTGRLLFATFLAGFDNDFVVCAGIVVFTLVSASIPGYLGHICHIRGLSRTFLDCWISSAKLIFAMIVVSLISFCTADVCYYAYNHQHLDFVFLEYVDELIQGASQADGSQAADQTAAELDDLAKWVRHIGVFWTIMALLISAWLALQTLFAVPAMSWGAVGLIAALALAVPPAMGAATFSSAKSPLDQRFIGDSEAYYSLSQNPVLFAIHPLRDAFISKWTWSSGAVPSGMSTSEAIREAQKALGHGVVFPFPEYPFVRERGRQEQPYFGHPVNIVLIFVEGLDRRFVSHMWSRDETSSSSGSPVSSGSIHGTPFLDHLKTESIYFEHFFSNGVQTARGLFSTLCSAFPRQGTAAIKTRYKNDYLCLPTALRQRGYTTEMVAAINTDSLHLHEFLIKNGIERYYDQTDLTSRDEQAGIGMTDALLFEFLARRVEALQSVRQPFFLAALTSSTHHPFKVPTDHPEVKGLLADVDPYVAALRYCDWTLEQFFSRLRSKHLLNDTLVIILGDHGRHEPIGHSDIERQLGHFLSPLYIWADDSLRNADAFRPRVVQAAASHIDITPTILSLNGVMPRYHPFVGHDLTCFFGRDCPDVNRVYLSSVYDDLIGLADASGIMLYSFRRNVMTAVDLDMKMPPTRFMGESDNQRARTLAALYLASNTLLEENRLWASTLPQ